MASEQLATVSGRRAVAAVDGDTARLAEGIEPMDLGVHPSNDGQCLMVHCGSEIVAMVCAMGGSPEIVQFADGTRYSLEALLDLVARE